MHIVSEEEEEEEEELREKHMRRRRREEGEEEKGERQGEGRSKRRNEWVRKNMIVRRSSLRQ